MTLLKTLPTIVSAFRESVKSFGGGTGEKARVRTEDDLGMGIVVGGSIVLALLIAVLPGFPHGPFPGSLVMSLLVVVFGFFFVTVSSRIVGIIGTSSNPISGMTIATLMGTCVVFVLIGRTGEAYQPVALCVGALVCIAAANAGATSQDLKTGLPRGRDAAAPADRLHHRRPRLDARHRRDAVPPRHARTARSGRRTASAARSWRRRRPR